MTWDEALTFDPEKDRLNMAKHGLSFADFPGFYIEPIVVPDDRRDYGELRFRAFGRVDGDARCLVFTVRDGYMRIISLRRVHAKEMRRHERQVRSRDLR